MRVLRMKMPFIVLTALVVGALLVPASIAVGTELSTSSESVSGTAPGYQTKVESVTAGTLTSENLRQASLLASQSLMHMIGATRRLEERDQKAAANEVDKALTLVGIIREMLPVTTETIVVTAPDGKEAYRHEERVQEDLIPIYDEMIQVEVVEPIVTAKKNRAAVEGVRLADVDLIRTSVLVDLEYVERKLERAKAEMGEPDKARAELLLAQTAGVRFVTNKQDTPLVETNYAAAQANLALAEDQLALYRGLVPAERHASIGELQREIDELSERVEEGRDSPGVIRGFWTRVTSWVSKEPGEASVTDAEADEGKS